MIFINYPFIQWSQQGVDDFFEEWRVFHLCPGGGRLPQVPIIYISRLYRKVLEFPDRFFASAPYFYYRDTLQSPE